MQLKVSRRQAMIDLFPGGKCGGSEPTCYWWLNSHLKPGKNKGCQSTLQTTAQSNSIGNACAESEGGKHYLKADIATMAVGRAV